MSKPPLKVLLDTNVWLDHYLGIRSGNELATRTIDALAAAGAALYVSAPALKDIYFLLAGNLKHNIRATKNEVDEANARACNECAWACIRQLMEIAVIVPVGSSECWDAFTLKEEHADFEDDLILAAARAADIDWIVSSDRKLQARSSLPVLSPREACAKLSDPTPPD